MSDFIRCPNCNAKNYATARNCDKCGAELYPAVNANVPPAQNDLPVQSAPPSPTSPPDSNALAVPPPPPAINQSAVIPQQGDPRILSVEQRQAILAKEIQHYIKQDFRVVSQTATTAQLVKPKRMSCGVALLVLIVSIFTFGILFLLYLIWYIAQKDQQVYIDVDEYGKVNALNRAG